MRWRLLLVISLLGLFLSTAPSGAQTASTAAFTEGDCPFKPGAGFIVGANLRCGTLIVPENHQVTGGPTIRLAVAIFRTPSIHRLPDPVVFLQGGPGGGTLSLGKQITSLDAQTLMGNHDLILIDQRGTGYSRPKLVCTKRDLVHGQNTTDMQYLRHCRSRLSAKGIDLGVFNTIENAADIADLRTALNLPEMDLYGVSYGSRLALAVMRYYPAGIRSVVLDSVVTPHYNLLTDAVAGEGRAFNALFAGCARSRTCRQHFPYLKRTFQRLLSRLNQSPLHVTVQQGKPKRPHSVTVSGDDFAEIIRASMYDTQLIPFLPAVIQQVNHAETRALRPLISFTNQEFSGIADALYESVTCADDAPYVSLASLRAAIATLPPAIRHESLIEHQSELRGCRLWHVPPTDASLHQPVTSDIPTLLLGGEYDPITPPSNTSLVASTLTRGYAYIFPGIGHGVRYSKHCPDTIVDAFYDDPTRAPDAACIGKMKEPTFFIPRSG